MVLLLRDLRPLNQLLMEDFFFPPEELGAAEPTTGEAGGFSELAGVIDPVLVL